MQLLREMDTDAQITVTVPAEELAVNTTTAQALLELRKKMNVLKTATALPLTSRMKIKKRNLESIASQV